MKISKTNFKRENLNLLMVIISLLIYPIIFQIIFHPIFLIMLHILCLNLNNTNPFINNNRNNINSNRVKIRIKINKYWNKKDKKDQYL